MNPVDYFNIYKRKMEELAHQRFDKQQDAVFYSYLDKLTNKEQFQKDGKVDGNKLLQSFITQEDSLTSQKKRNEQRKRWEYYLQERLAAGLPEKAVQLDPKLIARVYEFKDVKLVRPLPTK